MQPKSEESCLKRRAHTQVAYCRPWSQLQIQKSLNTPENLRYNPSWLLFCHRDHKPRDPCQEIGIQTLILAVDPEVGHELAPSFLGCSLRASGSNPDKLCQTVDSEKALNLGSSLSQPQFMSRTAGTGTQQEPLLFVPPELLKYPCT